LLPRLRALELRPHALLLHLAGLRDARGRAVARAAPPRGRLSARLPDPRPDAGLLLRRRGPPGPSRLRRGGLRRLGWRRAPVHGPPVPRPPARPDAPPRRPCRREPAPADLVSVGDGGLGRRRRSLVRRPPPDERVDARQVVEVGALEGDADAGGPAVAAGI